MKKLFQIFSIFLAIALYGQKTSDYQFIVIPEKFNDIKANKYGLKDMLIKVLKVKKYTIVQENSGNNLCNMLKAEVMDTGNLFSNKVKIEFKDCKDKSIGIFEGRSSLKDFEPGMRDALEVATRAISNSNPKEMVEDKVTPNSSYPLGNTAHTTIENDIDKNLTEIGRKEGRKSIQNLEVYTNGNLILNKIYLSKGEFVLAQSDNSAPYAMFKPSTKKEVYRVQLADGTTTLGYFEDSKIVVELANADGSYRKEVFSQK